LEAREQARASSLADERARTSESTTNDEPSGASNEGAAVAAIVG